MGCCSKSSSGIVHRHFAIGSDQIPQHVFLFFGDQNTLEISVSRRDFRISPGHIRRNLCPLNVCLYFRPITQSFPCKAFRCVFLPETTPILFILILGNILGDIDPGDEMLALVFGVVLGKTWDIILNTMTYKRRRVMSCFVRLSLEIGSCIPYLPK